MPRNYISVCYCYKQMNSSSNWRKTRFSVFSLHFRNCLKDMLEIYVVSFLLFHLPCASNSWRDVRILPLNIPNSVYCWPEKKRQLILDSPGVRLLITYSNLSGEGSNVPGSVDAVDNEFVFLPSVGPFRAPSPSPMSLIPVVGGPRPFPKRRVCSRLILN